eukprot:975908_1
MTNVTDVGAFGEILSKYCGSNITQQFYTFKHNQPMLLTEYEMGSLLFENFLTYLIFLSFITTIKISVSIYKDAFTPTKNKDESDEIKSFKCKTRLYGIGTCVQRFMIVLSQRFGHPDLWALFGRIYRKILSNLKSKML